MYYEKLREYVDDFGRIHIIYGCLECTYATLSFSFMQHHLYKKHKIDLATVAS